MDSALYTTTSRSELADLGSINYHLFDRAVVLDQVMRQAGKDPEQQLFRGILMRLRNGEVTHEDWEHLMKRTPAEVGDTSPFDEALRLFPTVELVSEYNVSKLCANGQPVAVIKAVHSGPGASKASFDDAGGLQPVVHIAHGARVMLTFNLWVEVGLVNGAVGTVEAICYGEGESPPSLPVAVTVHFDSYTGPTLPDGTVPITPQHRTWLSTNKQCSRLQLPLKLSWAVTIHKSQGMTLDKVVIDVGKKEFSSGLTFVACSRVRRLTDILFPSPFPYERLSKLANNTRLKERLQEDERLHRMSNNLPPLPPRECRTAEESAAEGGKDAPPSPSDDKHDADKSPPEGKVEEGKGGDLPPGSEQEIDDDLIEEGATFHTFKYNPGGVEWQQSMCEQLGLTYRGPNGVTPGGPDVVLRRPTSFRSTDDDGNCLFRSLCYIITGSEADHMIVRAAIIGHMRAIAPHIWEGFLRALVNGLTEDERRARNWHIAVPSDTLDADSGVQLYITATGMDRSKVWGSEVEIMTLANLLDTPIASYVWGQGWMQYNPMFVHGMMDSTVDPDQPVMYLRHHRRHYDVVRSVRM